MIKSILDALCIAPFKALMLLGLPTMLSFLGGIVALCVLCTVVGELTMALAYFLNRKHWAKLQRDMVVHQNLSIKAIKLRDKESYKACNTMANEAFGLSFFSGVALFAASLWPAFFALDWMGTRFAAVTFVLPLLGKSVGYTFFFIPLYVAVRVVFGRWVKPRLWPFNRIKAWVKANEDCGEELMSWADLMAPVPGKENGKSEGQHAG
ncbi:hypothetical protein dsx2_2228 [Desulfovibrio sp. X2]|uniref:hypothetical protein n=1 Tax=Desulfovibrio sp. X2 TaxID=941449 RepID=UPI00035884BF|nr:hypothetical protein [Desulfovibrio sp. X2]EPR43611.1 hypothetical protein dsx2_2228 [Desulfovibrio sp. X2]